MTRKIYIDTTAQVHSDAQIGLGSMVWNWTKIREGVKIGTDCNIGQCVYVDFYVEIGNNCKIQNNVSVYHGVTIADDVFVGPNATFTNDLYPRATSLDWQVTPTAVHHGTSIGANSTIICGVTLGQYCMIGAGAVVTKDVEAHTLVVGQPAKAIDYVTASGKRLYHDMSKLAPNDSLLIDV